MIRKITAAVAITFGIYLKHIEHRQNKLSIVVNLDSIFHHIKWEDEVYCGPLRQMIYYRDIGHRSWSERMIFRPFLRVFAMIISRICYLYIHSNYGYWYTYQVMSRTRISQYVRDVQFPGSFDHDGRVYYMSKYDPAVIDFALLKLAADIIWQYMREDWTKCKQAVNL